MADAAFHLSREAQPKAAGPSGSVRFTAIRSILGRILAPALPALVRQHPALTLHLVGETRNLDLSRRESDVAIRLAMPTGPELITRKLADIAFAVYGHRDLAGTGAPWLTYTQELSHLPEAQWVERARAGRPVAGCANGIELLTQAAITGAGQAVLPCFVGDREPTLQRIQPAPVVIREAWLAVHTDDRRSTRIRAAMSFVIECFAAAEALLAGKRPKRG